MNPVTNRPMLDTNVLNIMVDIETTALIPRAGIWQIGATTFLLPEDINKREFVFTINPYNNTYGSSVGTYEWDVDTIKWQVTKNVDNWGKAISEGHDSLGTAANMLEAFSSWIAEVRQGYSGIAVWTKGSYFDIPILEHAFRLEEIEIPWKYWEVNDARTLYNLAKFRPPKNSIAHNGLEDAKQQVNDIESILLAWS